MGALVGYELARGLEKLDRPPVLLGVSGSPGPHMRRREYDRYLNLRTQEDLVGFLRDLGEPRRRSSTNRSSWII